MLKNFIAFILVSGLSASTLADDKANTPGPNSRIISLTPGGDPARAAAASPNIAREPETPASKPKKRTKSKLRKPRTSVPR